MQHRDSLCRSPAFRLLIAEVPSALPYSTAVHREPFFYPVASGVPLNSDKSSLFPNFIFPATNPDEHAFSLCVFRFALNALLHAATAGAACEITSIVITVKPEALIADGAPAFAFSTKSGAKPSFGFECELRTSDVKDVAAVHAWQACASPKAYTGLKDGNYVFSVRVKGEPSAESHAFQVDISPPETVILTVSAFICEASSASCQSPCTSL
jgi:hypothetical protein